MPTEPPTPTPGPEPSRALPSLASAALTDPGREREENEDAFGEFPGARLFVVADGMGGRAGGGGRRPGGHRRDRAVLPGAARWPRAGPGRSRWTSALSFGTNLLAVGLQGGQPAHPRGRRRQPRTTTAWAPRRPRWRWARPRWWSAHVGDVRVYRLRAGALTPLTRDHSVVEEVRAARPEMTDAELGAIANRNVVTRALGTREEVEATVTSHPLERGDLYLLCSDGLWSMVEPNRLAQLLGAGTGSGRRPPAA